MLARAHRDHDFEKARPRLERGIAGMMAWAKTLLVDGGGLGYDRDPHTPISSCMVIGLDEVRRAGIEAPDLAEARATLKGMRTKGGLYPYDRGCRVLEDQPRYTVGRTPIAEWALYRAGDVAKEDLSRSLDLYLDHWREAWDARGRATGSEPEPDYFLFTRWYAMVAARETGRLGDAKVRPLRTQLLEQQDADGSWLDSIERTGHVAGTAFAILSLAASHP